MTKAIERVIENYINGNLTDAKKGAKKISWRKLFLALWEDYGKSEIEAASIANYLKGLGLGNLALVRRTKSSGAKEVE